MNMKKILLFIILVLASSAFLPSCRKILFDGEDKSRVIQTGDFHAIRISGIYNIVLIQDSAGVVEIKGSNIQSVDAIVTDDTLIIDDHKKIQFNPNKNTIVIHFKSVNYMVTYDPVNVSNKDSIKGEKFSYDAIGEIAQVNLSFNVGYLVLVNSANTLGQFRFSGKATVFSSFNRYGCTIFASNLSCNYAYITNESVGDVYVNSSDFIQAYIWGPGNIYYSGNPLIEIAEKKGDGKLIRFN